ncbi:MAG: nucleoside/nucleotide kinase family protein [Anaerolineaceae bacterium]|nr:nucleoside/nucleotide kinase family protein [Anaerolineaceae bacterium]
MELDLEVSGFVDRAVFDDEEIETLHRPLLRHLTRLARDSRPPFIVLLGATAGSGKSILATFWEWLSRQDDELLSAQALSIDGFHFPNVVMKRRTIMRDGRQRLMHDYKGAPESFDLAGIRKKLSALRQGDSIRWPLYDRKIHDPVEDAIAVTSPLVILEGNYVLLDSSGWRELRSLADFGIFLETDVDLTRERLRQRKLRGGYGMDWVEEHYARSDGPNTRLILGHRLPADITLAWRHADGRGGWVAKDDELKIWGRA